MMSIRQYRQALSGRGFQAVNHSLMLAAVLMLGMVATRSAQAQTFTVLHAFEGAADGGSPNAGLFRDSAGNLYGTAYRGGLYDACNCGTVFQLGPTGELTVLYAFSGTGGSGEYPAADLAGAVSGLYGSASGGLDGNNGYGVLFRVGKTGETVLYTFAGTGADGETPVGRLLRDSAGNLYGATNGGGLSGYGTVFKLDTSGVETVLHNFVGSDGAFPGAGLVPDAAGNLYGTAINGGEFGWGAVYRLLRKNGEEQLLYSFSGASDGVNPTAPVTLDNSGNLYGTTYQGGAFYYYGTVFKLNQNGEKTILHSFTGGADGAYPNTGLARDSAGNLYGTAVEGGDLACFGVGTGCGTVFKISSTGNFSVLHSFSGALDGAGPSGDLVLDASGNLYGTAYSGGAYGFGVAFKLTP